MTITVKKRDKAAEMSLTFYERRVTKIVTKPLIYIDIVNVTFVTAHLAYRLGVQSG